MRSTGRILRLTSRAELQPQCFAAWQYYGCSVRVCPSGGQEEVLVARLQHELESFIAESVGSVGILAAHLSYTRCLQAQPFLAVCHYICGAGQRGLDLSRTSGPHKVGVVPNCPEKSDAHQNEQGSPLGHG